MANSHYQIATIPKLYISFPLYQYANGGGGAYYDVENAIDSDNVQSFSRSDYYKLIQLDPSNSITKDQGSEEDFRYISHAMYNIQYPETSNITSSVWDIDYAMILNHNFGSAGMNIEFKLSTGGETPTQTDILTPDAKVNNCYADTSFTYDGWSLFDLNIQDYQNAERNMLFQMKINNTSFGIQDEDFTIGTFMFGKSFTFPQNCMLNTTTEFQYGIKQSETISGKTISTANWVKPESWNKLEPFGLEDLSEFRDDALDYARRSGRRKWTMNFDSLVPENVMNQNMMNNSLGYTLQDNHTSSADGTSSLYNNLHAVDFYTLVVNRSLGGHLPMVLQINKDDYSPSNFAIVRMNKNFKITQKSPNLYNIKVQFIEQI